MVGAPQPDRGQRLDRERDRLGVAVGAGHARQLDARLHQLALPARRALQAHDRPLVAQPHGARLVAVARRDQARDLRRDVGPQRDHLARARLDEAERRRARRVPEPERQHLLVFERGRDDAREPAPLERRQQAVDDAPPRGRRLGRVIAHPGRQSQYRSLGHGRGRTDPSVLGRGPDLTALRTMPSLRKPTNTSASSIATFSCASRVDAPRCGLAIRFSCLNSGAGSGGSLPNTSSAAPASWPDVSASSTASSSTMPPRAQLIR